MLRFYAARYLELIGIFTSIRTRFEGAVPEELLQTIPSSLRDQMRPSFEMIRDDCGGMGLGSTRDQAIRILGRLKDARLTLTDLNCLQVDLEQRFRDELDHELLFHVDRRAASYYINHGFSADVVAVFPKASMDMEEAAKCFALGRYTASVFHLMRVTEHGLMALASYLGVACDFKTWDPIIKKLRAEVENYKASSFKGSLDFLRHALDRLTAVQLALRNEVMHARSFYDEERAADIYRSVIGFMEQLAPEVAP